LEKFLNVCWKHDGLTGEANFDIDSEKINLTQPALFSEMNVPNKRQVFEEVLRTGILSGKLKNNLEVYVFSLSEGFLPKDANLILKELEHKNKIFFDFKLSNSKVHKQELSPIKII
jgi:hypothetical protein